MDISLFAHELWIARGAIWAGFQMTVAISILAVGFGTLLGVFVGLSLTYGWLPLRFITRVYVDFIRGTPVFVLVLASFYILSVIIDDQK